MTDSKLINMLTEKTTEAARYKHRYESCLDTLVKIRNKAEKCSTVWFMADIQIEICEKMEKEWKKESSNV